MRTLEGAEVLVRDARLTEIGELQVHGSDDRRVLRV